MRGPYSDGLDKWILKLRGYGRAVLLTACFLSCGAICSTSNALDVGDLELSITLDSTFVSEYVWHGYNLLDQDKPAWQPSIELSFSKFTVGVWSSYSLDRDFDDLDELDYYLGWNHTFDEEDGLMVDVWLSYTYFDFYRSDSRAGDDGIADFQEFGFGFALPQVLAFGDSFLVPSYSGYFEFGGIDAEEDIVEGWIHVLGLSYDLPLGAEKQDSERQTLSLTWDITYNSGAFGSTPAWSHTTFGVSTTFNWKLFYLTPALNYQWSFEDTVNDENEFYLSLSSGMTF